MKSTGKRGKKRKEKVSMKGKGNKSRRGEREKGNYEYICRGRMSRFGEGEKMVTGKRKRMRFCGEDRNDDQEGSG